MILYANKSHFFIWIMVKTSTYLSKSLMYLNQIFANLEGKNASRFMDEIW